MSVVFVDLISRLSESYFRVTKRENPWNEMVKAGAHLLDLYQIITSRFLSYKRRYYRFSTANSYYVRRSPSLG